MSETVFKGSYTGAGRPKEKRALLVIDVQNEYFTGKLPVCYPAETLPNILAAVKTAQSRDIPVVIVQHTMTDKGGIGFCQGHRRMGAA
jgi:nicotinamidase-related amidase